MTPIFEDLRLITVAELAELCRTGEDWIRKGAAARKFAWTKAGREIKFTREQAAAVIASLEVAPAGAPRVDQLAAKRDEARRSSRRAASP